MFSSPISREALGPLHPQARLATGFKSLDALLGGGFPVGAVVELSGGASSGKASLAFRVCLGVLAERAVAWLGPKDRFWPLAALEAGLCPDRLLVAQVPDGLSALKGAQIILSCPDAVGALVLDLPLGFTARPAQLLKLQRLAERSQTTLMLLTERLFPGPSLGPQVALMLHVARAPGEDQVVVQVVRHKGGPSHQWSEEHLRGPDRLRVRSTL